jgi:hypothetical protein
MPTKPPGALRQPTDEPVAGHTTELSQPGALRDGDEGAVECDDRPEEVRDSDVDLAALDAGQVPRVEARTTGGLLDRQAALGADCSERAAQAGVLGGLRLGHASNLSTHAPALQAIYVL